MTHQDSKRSNNSKQAFIALGANLLSMYGKPSVTIKQALFALGERGVQVVSTSDYFETPCFPAGFGPDFVNAVAEVQHQGESDALLQILHGIEADFGRTRETRWGGRALDIDLIAVGDQVQPDVATVRQWIDLPFDDQLMIAPEQLILPHPRLQDRAFVLVPLHQIAPDWVHPILNLSVTQMMDRLSQADIDAVKPLKSD